MGSFLDIVRALFLGILVSTAVANNVTCQKPKVRREWRQISTSERIDWITAVNVFIPYRELCAMLTTNF